MALASGLSKAFQGVSPSSGIGDLNKIINTQTLPAQLMTGTVGLGSIFNEAPEILGAESTYLDAFDKIDSLQGNLVKYYNEQIQDLKQRGAISPDESGGDN